MSTIWRQRSGLLMTLLDGHTNLVPTHTRWFPKLDIKSYPFVTCIDISRRTTYIALLVRLVLNVIIIIRVPGCFDAMDACDYVHRSKVYKSESIKY